MVRARLSVTSLVCKEGASRGVVSSSGSSGSTCSVIVLCMSSWVVGR